MQKTHLYLVAVLAFMLAVFAAPVFAQSSTPVTVTVESGAVFLVAVATSGFAGVVYSALGYYEGHLLKGEKFNSKQFLLTVALGGIVGIFVPIASPQDLSSLIGTGFTAFATFGAIYFVQKVIAIYFAIKNPSAPVQTSPH